MSENCIILQALSWEPQVNFINSNLEFPHSESVWSVFARLYQEHSLVSLPTGSPEQFISLSLNNEGSLKDETGYITATNCACSSRLLTKEDMCDCNIHTHRNIESS